jgi:acetoin utilization protein AcuB
MSQKTVGDCMSPNPVTIPADLSLADAYERMLEFGVRHLPVTDAGHVVGLVSERDLALVTGIPGVDKNRVEVREAMSEHPYIVSPEALLEDVVATMWDKKIGSTVVMAEGKLVGIFSVIDALAMLLTKLRGE